MTSTCPPDPAPIPSMDSTTILPKVYPNPPEVTVAAVILPPSTTREILAPTPSPLIATFSYVPLLYPVPEDVITTVSISPLTALDLTAGSSKLAYSRWEKF